VACQISSRVKQVDLRASVATVAWSHRLCDVLEAREAEGCSKDVPTVRHATLVSESEGHAGAMSSRRIDCRNGRRRKKEVAAATKRCSTFRWRDGGDNIGLIRGAQKRSTRLGANNDTVDWTAVMGLDRRREP
jgi:hypothetical protein